MHEAGNGMGVGAEEKMAEFVGEDVAEHVGVADAGMIAAENEILIVGIRINAVARVVHECLAEDVGGDITSTWNDADGEMVRPGKGRAGRCARKEVLRIAWQAGEPIQLNSSLSKDLRGASLRLCQYAGVKMGVIK